MQGIERRRCIVRISWIVVRDQEMVVVYSMNSANTARRDVKEEAYHEPWNSGVWNKVEYSTLGYDTDDGGQGTWK